MSIFDRFLSRGTDKQKTEKTEKTAASFPVSNGKRFSALDESAAEAKTQYPDDSKLVEKFVWSLKESCRLRNKKSLEGDLGPMKAEACFFLSEDRLTAYACVLPPENKGDELTLDEFLEDMRYEGIINGVLNASIPQDFSFGYFHIFPVARGTPPRPGEDGKVIELFQRRRHMRLEVENGSQVDFGQDMQLQPIRRGAPICLLRAPKEGTDGMDVTGQALPSPKPATPPIPQGENTTLGRGDHALLASADGILYIENDLFCVHEQKIIDGDLDQFQGAIRISGNLYIGGNVGGGVDVQASGDIVINGEIRQARVTSLEGTIRVQQGIYGTEGKTVISAGGQVQTPVVEWADIDAGSSVIVETISNSVIHCGGTVYAMTGRGMIVNSQIWAKNSVLCLRIGNLAGGRCRFSIGYPPHIPETWERLKEELAEAQSTVERLWEPITQFRRKGSRISDREKELLDRLVEQREFYMKRATALKIELKAVNQTLDKKTMAKIRCNKLYPFLDVQIGRLTTEITTIEENCNIHAEEYSIKLE